MSDIFPNIQTDVPFGALEDGQLLTTFQDKIVLTEVDVSSLIPGNSGKDIFENCLREVWLQCPTLPGWGAKHPTIPDCRCIGVHVTPSANTLNGNDAQGAPSNFTAIISWLEIRSDENGNTVNAMYIDQYQQQENRNYDINGNLTIAYYTPKAGLVPAQYAQYYNKRPGNIQVPRTFHSVRIIQYEDLEHLSLAERAEALDPSSGLPIVLPIYNNAQWGGFPAATLLYLGRTCSNDNIPFYRCQYNFLYNDRGWDKFFNLATGPFGVPGDIAQVNPQDYILNGQYGPGKSIPTPPPNGVGIYNMLPSDNFTFLLENVNVD